jgi:hypothetical protein
MDQYLLWINKRIQSFDDALGTCQEVVAEMKAAFPELLIKKGVVYSKNNPDNYDKQTPKEYPHWWLEAEKGEIVDPTVQQFTLIGEVIYKEIKNPTFRCKGCGGYKEDSDSDPGFSFKYYCKPCHKKYGDES